MSSTQRLPGRLLVRSPLSPLHYTLLDAVVLHMALWKRLEHQCRKTQLTVHRDMFTCQRNKVNTMCAEAKKTHYKEKLSDIRSHAQFYNIANKLLHRRKTITLPNYECAESLANKFADHFDEKIQLIRTTLQTPHSCAIDCTVCKSP